MEQNEHIYKIKRQTIANARVSCGVFNCIKVCCIKPVNVI